MCDLPWQWQTDNSTTIVRMFHTCAFWCDLLILRQKVVILHANTSYRSEFKAYDLGERCS